jgi:hypothetical protein
LEWYQSKFRQKWKIIWYSEESKSDDVTKNEVYEKFGVNKWKNDNDVESGTFKEGDIVYQFKMDEDEQVIRRANGKWLYVDMTTSTNKIIQVGDMKNVSIPFRIDSLFIKSFKKAFSELDRDDIIDDLQKPKGKLIDLIYYHYKSKS